MCTVPYLWQSWLFAKVCLSGGDTRHKGAAKPNDEHRGKNHKDRKKYKHHKCHGKKKFYEVTMGSDSDTGLSSSDNSGDHEDENIDELMFVIYPINVDTLHRGSEVCVDLETVKKTCTFPHKGGYWCTGKHYAPLSVL